MHRYSHAVIEPSGGKVAAVQRNRRTGIARVQGILLSLPDFRANTTRPERVTVRFQDIGGTELTRTGQGLLARAFCHEIDHLNGILFIHHLSALKRDSIKRKVRRMMRAGEW